MGKCWWWSMYAVIYSNFTSIRLQSRLQTLNYYKILVASLYPNICFFLLLQNTLTFRFPSLASPSPLHTFSVVTWAVSTGGSSLSLLMNSAALGNQCTFCCIKCSASSGLSYMDQPTSRTAGRGKEPHNSLTNSNGSEPNPKAHEAAALPHI